MTCFREVPIIKMLSCGLPGGLPEYVDSGTERVQHGSSCLSTEPALQVNDSFPWMEDIYSSIWEVLVACSSTVSVASKNESGSASVI